MKEIKEHMIGVEIGGYYPDGRPMLKCCGAVRCKSFYYSGVERPGLVHLSDVMTYWCKYTQEAIGADGGEVHPESCQRGRQCWEE